MRPHEANALMQTHKLHLKDHLINIEWSFELISACRLSHTDCRAAFLLFSLQLLPSLYFTPQTKESVETIFSATDLKALKPFSQLEKTKQAS